MIVQSYVNALLRFSLTTPPRMLFKRSHHDAVLRSATTSCPCAPYSYKSISPTSFGGRGALVMRQLYR
jgi:hypothetical protein